MNVNTRKVLLVVIGALFFFVQGFASEENAAPNVPIVATPPSKVADILAKVEQAETKCKSVTTYQTPLRATHGRLRSRGKLKMTHFVGDRPVVLCGFRESDQSWHVVEVHVHVAAKEGERVYTYTPVTPGYTVDRLEGRGTTRLIFDLADLRGEHIVVYRMHHLNIPEQAIEHELSGKHLLAMAEVRTYTPYHPDFENHLVNEGVRYLKGEILVAQEELRRANVYAKAFPQRLLADVIPLEIPMALHAIEQMDDEKWKADERTAIGAVYAEYALNKENAFRYSVSSANAIGATQFTNKGGNGTYSRVVRECVGAELNPRFPEGAENLRNAIKAEICLLDMELAVLPSVKELYERKPLIGGIYPVAAYNGGHGWAVELKNTLERSQIDLEDEDVALPERLVKKPSGVAVTRKKGKHARIKVTKKIENAQTAIYVQKYVSAINFLAEWFDRENNADTSAQ